MKTIFIIVTRGFIVRNILRSGVLDFLKKSDNRIVIFMASTASALPDYLRKEFETEKVILHNIHEPNNGKIYRKIYSIFSRLCASLVYTETTWMYFRVGNTEKLKRAKFYSYIEKFLFSFLSRFNFLKTLARYIEKKFFFIDSKEYKKYFDLYQPDVVFSTSIISKVDIAFLKEANRRKIKTVSMTKGWDHMAKLLFRFVPDKLIVQNNNLKEGAIQYQQIKSEDVIVSGFPQFDWYTRKDILVSREDFFRSIGVDPKKRLIFFGSEGAWAPDDHKIAEMLIDFIEKNKLFKESHIFVRPHFSDLRSQRFDRFLGKPHVTVDTNITRSSFCHDTWDPTVEETKKFVNSIYHCDMMITVASTLALDACCLGKPIITVGFNALFSPRTGEDVTSVLYETNHYTEVINTGGVDYVLNEEQLLNSVNNYLSHPEYKSAERQKLLEKLCYRVDGQSSKRVAAAILGEIE